MQYIDQNHKDLRLYILNSKFDRNLFKVISESEFTVDDTHVQFGILAESHFVVVDYDNTVITEICACTNVKELGVDSVKLSELDDANTELTFDNWHYSFNYKIENMDVGEIRLSTLHTKRSHPHTFYLEHIFPTTELNGTNPRTEIYITRDDGVLIETVHTYPNHNAMVFTTTILTNTHKNK